MKKVLAVSIDEAVIDAIKAKADCQNRTVSNYVETVLIESLED